jgi:hypothetical protein
MTPFAAENVAAVMRTEALEQSAGWRRLEAAW